jgi:hypothetical protein
MRTTHLVQTRRDSCSSDNASLGPSEVLALSVRRVSVHVRVCVREKEDGELARVSSRHREHKSQEFVPFISTFQQRQCDNFRYLQSHEIDGSLHTV